MTNRYIPAFLALLLLTAAGEPPTADVVAQRGDVRLTAAEVRDMLGRIDPATRAKAEASTATLAGFVRDRLLDQAMLAEARAKGWDQKPDVIQRANDARDAVVLQSYVASLVPADPAFPGDAEIAAAYEANKTRFMLPRQYHLAQILVQAPQGAPEDETKRKAAELRARAIKPKADFADLAKHNSQDPTTADKDGDLGWLREDQMIPALKDAVAGLPENGTSEPIRLQDGFHIIRLLGTRPAGAAALADVKPQLVQALRQLHAQQAVRAYIDEMLRKDPIQLNEIDLARQINGTR
jgi:peptidylprolyl isomerase